MTINELKNKLKPGVKIQVNRKRYTILQHIVWWQAKLNKIYDKYVLEREDLATREVVLEDINIL